MTKQQRRRLRSRIFTPWRVIALIIVVLPLSCAYLEDRQRAALITGGLPLNTSDSWKNSYRVLRNSAFMVGYSDLRRSPVWVSYMLHPIAADQRYQKYPRPRSFTQDWRTLWPVEHQDYTHSGYDRGHLAPNYAISLLYGRKAQLETFLMSNISPQKASLNRHLWQQLEEMIIKQFTHQHARINVITGPVFDDETLYLPSAWVEIPDAFYKIIIGLSEDGEIRTIYSFLMPQDAGEQGSIWRYAATLDEIEKVTGFDFIPEIKTMKNP